MNFMTLFLRFFPEDRNRSIKISTACKINEATEKKMSPFTQSCFLLLPRSEVSDVRPRPLLRRAPVLHPAENAAGCHGSSAGNGEGGARLQLRLPPDRHQHPGEELQPHRARLGHHLCGPVLPRGNRAAATCSDVLPLLRRAFTLFFFPPSVVLGAGDRILSPWTTAIGPGRRSATGSGPTR